MLDPITNNFQLVSTLPSPEKIFPNSPAKNSPTKTPTPTTPQDLSRIFDLVKPEPDAILEPKPTLAHKTISHNPGASTIKLTPLKTPFTLLKNFNLTDDSPNIPGTSSIEKTPTKEDHRSLIEQQLSCRKKDLMDLSGPTLTDLSMIGRRGLKLAGVRNQPPRKVKVKQAWKRGPVNSWPRNQSTVESTQAQELNKLHPKKKLKFNKKSN